MSEMNEGSGGEQPVEEQPVEEQPVEEQPVEEQPVDEQPVEEQPAGGEQPVQPDWSRLQQTQALIQFANSDPGGLVASLGVDTSPQEPGEQSPDQIV